MIVFFAVDIGAESETVFAIFHVYSTTMDLK